MRGQAAMEFLTTYGWAIMVVLVAVGALAYFGIFNVDNTMADRCIAASGFSCANVLMTADSDFSGYASLIFELDNNLGRPIQVRDLDITCLSCNPTGAVTGMLIEDPLPPEADSEKPWDAGETFCWAGTSHPEEAYAMGEFKNAYAVGDGDKTPLNCYVSENEYSLKAGDKARLAYTMHYTYFDSEIYHTAKGEVVTRVEN